MPTEVYLLIHESALPSRVIFLRQHLNKSAKLSFSLYRFCFKRCTSIPQGFYIDGFVQNANGAELIPFYSIFLLSTHSFFSPSSSLFHIHFHQLRPLCFKLYCNFFFIAKVSNLSGILLSCGVQNFTLRLVDAVFIIMI